MTFIARPRPVVAGDGVGGAAWSELVVVTDDGYEQLSAYGYTPFG